MKVKSIYIHGMHNISGTKEYLFDDRNYLVGTNGAGKSTVLQAIQLALLGYIPGYNKTDEGIFMHSNGNTMSVKLSLSNNVTIERTWTKVGGKLIKDVQVTPEGSDIDSIVSSVELPIYNFNDFIKLTANESKKWFTEFLPKQEVDVDLPSKLRSINNVVNGFVVDESMISELMEQVEPFKNDIKKVNDHIKSTISFLRAEIKKQTGNIQSLIKYEDIDDTKSKEEILQEINTSQENLSKAIGVEKVKDNNARIHQQIRDLNLSADTLEDDEEYKSLVERRNKVDDATMENYMDEIDKINSRLNALKSDKKYLDKIITSASENTCPITNNPCNDLKALYDDTVQKQRSVQSSIDKFEKELSEKDKACKAMQDLIYELNNEISRIEDNYERKSELMSHLEVEEFIDGQENFDVDATKSKIRELQDTYDKVVANEAYDTMYNDLLKDRLSLEKKLDVYKEWETLTDVNHLQRELSMSVFQDCEEEMSEYIRKVFDDDHVKCTFVSEEKANSFSFGITRSHETYSEYIPFSLLSSGEKCLYTLVLVSYIIKHSDTELNLVMIDDMLDHLDDKQISEVFHRLRNNIEDVQYIVAGVRPQSKEGWTTIDVSVQN